MKAVYAICVMGLLAASFAAEFTPEQKKKLMEHTELCVKESGVKVEVLEKLKKGEQASFDEELNKYATCMLKRIGIMKADGTIDEEVARMKAPKDVPKESIDMVINQCKTLVGSNTFEFGGKVFACMLKNKVFALP